MLGKALVARLYMGCRQALTGLCQMSFYIWQIYTLSTFSEANGNALYFLKNDVLMCLPSTYSSDRFA